MARRWVPDSSPMGGHWAYNEVPGDQGYGEGLGTAPGGTGVGGGTVLPGGIVEAGGGRVIGGILLPPQPISPFDWTVLFPQLAGSPPPKSTNDMAATIGSVQAAKPGNVVPIVYGTQRVEGQLIYSEAHAAASANFAYVVCSGPISAIRKVFINGHEVPSSVAYITYDYHLSGGVYGAYTQPQDSWMVASQFSGVGPTVSRFPGVVVARVFIQAPLAGMTWSDAVPDGPNISSVAFEVDGLVVTELRENRVPSSNDFRSAAGWASTYTPPTVTTGLADPFGGTSAMQLAFGAAGPNDWYLDVAGNSTTAGATTRAAMWVRVASGTVSATIRCRKTGGTGTEEGSGHAVIVTTTWTRITRKRTTTGDGTGLGLRLYIAAGTPTIEVFCAQLDTLTTDRGSMVTAGTAILVNTVRFTANWATCFYHFATDGVLGCGASTTYVDPDNFGDAAALCEQYGFAMNLVLANEATASRWIEAMRPLACAELYFEDGYYRVWIDTPQGTLAATFISGRTDGLPIGTWNAREVQYDAIASSDQPTRVIIEFPNAAKNYERDTTLVEVSGVSEGTTELREARYVLDGCTSETQAQRLATYIVNQANAALRVTFISSFVGITLARGSLIALSSGEGLAAQQFLVEDKERAPSGVYSLRCRQYSAASYDPSVVVGDAAVTSSLLDLFTAVEVSGIGNALGYGAGSYSPLIFWDPPHSLAPAELYSATWTGGGGGAAWASFDGSQVNDGDEATTAAVSASGLSVLYATLDLGAGITKNFGALRVVASSTGIFKPEVQYSDDGVNYSGPVPTGPYLLGTSGATEHLIQWVSASAHRYWRVYFTRTGTQTITLQEAQFRVTRGDHPFIKRWLVYRGADPSGLPEELLLSVEGSRAPTQALPLDLTAHVVADTSGGTLYKILNLIVKTETAGGVVSTGVAMYRSGATDGTERAIIARAGATAPAEKQANTSQYIEQSRAVSLVADTFLAIKDASPAVSAVDELRLKSASGVLQVSVHGGAYAAPAPGAHTHSESEVTSLVTDLAAKLAIPGSVGITMANGLNSNFTKPTARTAFITGPTAAFSLGGIASGALGDEITFINKTAWPFTIVNQDASSADANKILGPNNGNITLGNYYTSVTLRYAAPFGGAPSRWVVMGPGEQFSTVAPLINGTAAVGTSENASREDHVHPTDTTRAALASPVLTGNPTGPTPAVDDNDTSLATTAYVQGQKATATPAVNGTGAAGTSPRWSAGDHVHPTDTSRAPTASPTFTGPITGGGILRCGTTGSLADNVATNVFTVELGPAEVVAGELRCYIAATAPELSYRQVGQRMVAFQAYENAGAITVQTSVTDLGNLLSSGTLGITFSTTTTATTFTIKVTADTSVGSTLSISWTLIIPRAVTVT